MSFTDPFSSDDEDTGTIFRDVITLSLAGFISIVVLMLPHLNPPEASAAAEGSNPPGNVMVEMRWPDQMDADMDLWVQAPGDIPVGYSNKGGLIFNLLRDDLGKFGDATDMNYEISYGRGIPPGEYTVNVHAYRNNDKYPVPVNLVVSVKNSESEPIRQILTTKIVMRQDGEEVTAFRFKLTDKGMLEPDSVTSLYKPLRSASKR